MGYVSYFFLILFSFLRGLHQPSPEGWCGGEMKPHSIEKGHKIPEVSNETCDRTTALMSITNQYQSSRGLSWYQMIITLYQT